MTESGAEDTRLSRLCMEVIRIAGPNALGYISALINELANVVALGHMGNDAALAAVGLGNMMQNCIGLSVAFGLSSALDTLVSQAHGAGQHHLSVLYFQRMRLLLTVQLIWMVPLLAYSREILVFIHQDKEVAADAGEYNSISIYGLIAVFQFETGRKFFQNQEYTAGPAAIGWMCSALHVVWCYIFVVHLDWGNKGAGFANITTWYLEWACMLLYTAWQAPKLGFRRAEVLGFSRNALRGWGQLLSVGLPATAQLCCEWWFWEICSIIVGYLGAQALAAHVATINVVALCFMPTIGVSAAAATLAGNAIGAGKAMKAKKIIWTCAFLNTIVWTILAALIVLLRWPIAEMYTKETGVQDVMTGLLVIFAVAGYFDCNQNIFGGGLRGLGHNTVSSMVYIVGYYLIMLPLGIALAFPAKVGVEGVWYSFVVGTGCALLFFVAYVCWLDFNKVVEEAKERMAGTISAASETCSASLIENGS